MVILCGGQVLNDIETLGDLAGTSATARALEPVAGEHNDTGHSHESACLNCATPLIGRHCYACGQAAHVHKTLAAFFHDLLHGVFHFEGKIWRTLPMLVTRPGKLTREYIDGRRASYVSPIALFLFCVFLLFTTLNSLGNDLDVTVKIESDSIIPWIKEAFAKAKANPGLALYKVQSFSYKLSWALIPISVPFLWLLFPFSRRFGIYDHTVFVTYSLCFMTLLTIALTIVLKIVLVLGGKSSAQGLAVAGMLVPPLHIYRQLIGTYSLTLIGGLWRTAMVSMFAFTALSLFALLILAEVGA